MDEFPSRVMSAYAGPLQPRRWAALGNAGGLSGARLWRLQTAAGDACLRRWPAPGPDRERLQWAHRVVGHWRAEGLAFVPAPWTTLTGETLVWCDDAWWELAPWMPGEPDADMPVRPTRMAAVIDGLARLHRAGAGLQSRQAPCPAAGERLAALQTTAPLQEQLAAALRSGSWRGYRDAVPYGLLAERLARRWAELATRWAGPLERELAAVADEPTLLLPAIRDVRREHLLFQGNTLSGVVDFGALRLDSPAVDVARCFRSLLGPPSESWTAGLEQYRRSRPGDGFDPRLLAALDRAALLLGPSLWLRWLILEQRFFEAHQAVEERLRAQLEALEELAAGT